MSLEVPEGQKGTKNYVPRVSGAQPGDKIDFLAKRKIRQNIDLVHCISICYALVWWSFLFVDAESVDDYQSAI